MVIGRLDTFGLEFDNKKIMPKGMVMGRLDTSGLEFDMAAVGLSRTMLMDPPGMISTSWKFLVFLNEQRAQVGFA